MKDEKALTVPEKATELIKVDEETLAELQAMASDEEQINRIPILKINYDAESKHERGVWVVGQKKDKEGNITEEGDVVRGIVILEVRNRFNLYNMADASKSCNSSYHPNRTAVNGTKYGFVCGQTCPHRAADAKPRCKAQKVVFGLAITNDNKVVECISYVQGSSYMPLVNHLDFLTKKKVESGYVKVPTFAYLTVLGSTKAKNAGTVFWVATFSQGDEMFPIPQQKKFFELQKKVCAYIDDINAAVLRSGKQTDAVAATAAPVSLKSAVPDIQDVPFEILDKKTSGLPPVLIKKEEPDFDIESAIRSAVSAKKAA